MLKESKETVNKKKKEKKTLYNGTFMKNIIHKERRTEVIYSTFNQNSNWNLTKSIGIGILIRSRTNQSGSQ